MAPSYSYNHVWRQSNPGSFGGQPNELQQPTEKFLKNRKGQIY